MLIYAEFCEKYGRDKEALRIYQKMLKCFTYMPKKKKEIRDKIEACLTSDQSKTGAYRDKLSQYKRVENNPEIIETVKDEMEEFDDVPVDLDEEEDVDAIFEEEYADKKQ